MALRYTEADVPNQRGKTILVTGANTGIGFEAARVLAERGARVLLACRSEAKAAQALQRIKTRSPQADLGIVLMDLADLSNVKAAVERIAEEPRLDAMINNAGVMVPPRTLTADGFESQFGINHLGHFALTGLLMSKLLEQPDARVINVSSSAHKFARIDFDDVHAERGYSAGARYGMSKLANLLFTFELQRRVNAAGVGLRAVACHPGGADTELARHLPKALYTAIRPFALWVINTAAEGALPTLRAVTDPEAVGGDYYGPAGPFEIAHSAVRVQPGLQARNEADARRLWDLSVQLTGVEPLAAD